MKFIKWFASTSILSLLITSTALAAGGMTGWYQSNGTGAQPYYNSSVGGTNYNNSGAYNYENIINQNYNNVGIGNYNGYSQNNNNYRNPTGGGLTAYYGANNFNQATAVNTYTPPAPTLTDSQGGLTAYYGANNFPRQSITYQPPAPTLTNGYGGFTQYFSQNLQANTFAGQCNPVAQPNPATCQGGNYREIKNNYGCTIDWRCEGGNFCPVVERPPESQCNGTWEPQRNTGTQCLTHYFCDRTPDHPVACPLNYDPVCGLLGGNSVAYSNDCHLQAAGAQFQYRGQCRTNPTPTPITQVVIESFNGPINLEVNQSGTWTVRARGGRNDQLSYQIDWGETQYAANRSQVRRPVQQTTFSHQYANAGIYTVRITVTNQNGQSATSQKTVQVGSGRTTTPNITSFSGPSTLRVGQSGTFTVIANHPIDKGINFSINYGDSHYSPSNQTSQVRRGSSQTFQHSFSRPGNYTVTVTASTDGQSVTRSLNVRVDGNQPNVGTAPVVRGISGPTTLRSGQTGTWRVQATEPNNQDLSYQINWGDEQYGAQSRYAGQQGFVQNSAFTHVYNQAGTYTVSVTVRNESGQTARTSTTVRVDREPVYEPYQPTVPSTPYVPYYTPYQQGYQYTTVPQFDIDTGGLEYQPSSNPSSRHSIFNRSYSR